MSFTDKLNLLMKERGLNKSQLSAESGIPYTTIDGFYKKGSDNIKLSTLRKLATFFDCSLDYLVDDGVENDKVDDTVLAVAERLHKSPGLRMVFDATEDVTEEALEATAEMLKQMKKDSGYE